MNAIHVTPTWFHEKSILGGGERYVHELTKFQNRKINAEIVSFGTEPKEFALDGVRHRVHRARHWKHFTMSNPFALAFVCGLRQANVIHVHQLCTFVSDLAALAGHMWGIPVVGTDHGGGGAWVLNRRLPVRRCYSMVFGQSKLARDLIASEYPCPAVAIPGGVDLDIFQPGSTEARKRVVLFVGRLLPHKGIATLIEAFRRWNNPAYELLMLGRPSDPAFFKELKQAAHGLNARFVIDADDTTLLRAYQEAMFAVLPSETPPGTQIPPELMGFTLLEAQACGLPIVATNSGPAAEFILPGETGAIVPQCDPDALALALNEIARHIEANPQKTALRCREHVTQFKWESVAEEHVQHYRRLIEAKVPHDRSFEG